MVLRTLVALTAALAINGQRLDQLKADEASRCNGKPGSEPKYRIVTQKYADEHVDDPDHATFTIGDDVANPVEILNGCPVYYGLKHPDFSQREEQQVFLKMVRENADSVLLMEWDMQDWFTVARHWWWTEGYNPNGLPYSPYYIWRANLVGQLTKNHGNYNGFFRNANQDNSSLWDYYHNGASDPMVMTIDAQFDGSLPSNYEGMWKWTFHQVSSAMNTDDYNNLLDIYLTSCSPHRGGAGAYEPFPDMVGNPPREWSVNKWRSENSSSWDTLEYCGWMMEGWQKTELEANNHALACSLIDGAVCDADGRITYLSITGLGLRGTLPSGVGNLHQLWYLNMRDNQFTGSIPANTFIQHPSLKTFIFRNNQLHGAAPCFTGDVNLEVVDVGRNKFEGSLPQGNCLTDATGLRGLFLDSNFFHGSLPDWSQLRSLDELYVYNNHIEGTIPETLCLLTNLYVLYADFNQLVGTIPTSCMNPVISNAGTVASGWGRMYNLRFKHNRLTGTLPKLGPGMINVKRVDFAYNYFTGPLTDQFQTMVDHIDVNALTEVYVQGNKLSGGFPEVILNFAYDVERFNYFDVSDNLFRCENNGRYKDEFYRIGGYTDRMDHGVCKPVPQPTGITPTSGKVGTTITVEGIDILQSALGSCLFYKEGAAVDAHGMPTGTVAVSGGKILKLPGQAPKMQCYVPATLPNSEQNEIVVTISNYGEDYSLPKYWEGSTTNPALQKFTILKDDTVFGTGNQVLSQMTLTGETAATFNQAAFRSAVAEIAQVPLAQVKISLTPIAAGRRLTSGLPVYIEVLVPNANPSSSEAISQAEAIRSRLSTASTVRATLQKPEYGFDAVTSSITAQPVSKVEPELQIIQGSHTTKKEDDMMLGIIIAVVVFVVVSFACCFVCFLRYREKKGQPFFQETLDEGNAGGAGATGASYGNTA